MSAVDLFGCSISYMNYRSHLGTNCTDNSNILDWVDWATTVIWVAIATTTTLGGAMIVVVAAVMTSTMALHSSI